MSDKLKEGNMESLLKLIFAAAIVISISSSVALAGRCHRHHGWQRFKSDTLSDFFQPMARSTISFFVQQNIRS